MRTLLIVLCLIFNVYAISVTAQTTDYFQVALKDAIDKEPISFATVRIKDSRQGLIADANGEFRLPLGFQTSETVLIITSISYQSIEIEVSKLALDDLNIFYLKPYTDSLNEIIIVQDESKRRRIEQANALVKAARAKTADELIYLAIKNIPNNLSRKPSSVLGYYRDYQIFNDQYYNLNEGIVEMYDDGILTNAEAYDSFKAAIYTYKNNPEFTQDSAYIVTYDKDVKYIQNAFIRPNGGNELTILNVHNPIRNYAVSTFSFVYVLRAHFLNNHNFRRDGITYLDGEPLARINFTSKPGVQGYSHKVFGYILISLKDYSIHRFNYEIYDNYKKNALSNILIEYRRQNDIMYLNYITFNNRFVMTDQNILKEEKIIFYPEGYKFLVSFTKPIDLISLKRSNFNIKFGNLKLYIEEIKPRTNESVELFVRPFFNTDAELRELDNRNFSFDFKNIKDLAGNKIYKSDLIVGYQFREFFAQEVFSNKSLPENTSLMINDLPIPFSEPNEKDNVEKYWLNTPLRSTVTIKRD